MIRTEALSALALLAALAIHQFLWFRPIIKASHFMVVQASLSTTLLTLGTRPHQ